MQQGWVGFSSDQHWGLLNTVLVEELVELPIAASSGGGDFTG